jgi:hypothetical protein
MINLLNGLLKEYRRWRNLETRFMYGCLTDPVDPRHELLVKALRRTSDVQDTARWLQAAVSDFWLSRQQRYRDMMWGELAYYGLIHVDWVQIVKRAR